MNKSVLTAIVIASLTSQATAQSASASLDVFLEQRVAEELGADGTILSRLGVALDVEAVGDKLIVSLVDPATRRAVASTKIDRVPADREAAVASVTQVAANLASQLGVTARPMLVGSVTPSLDDIKRHNEAEWRYRQEMVTFGRETSVSVMNDTTTVTNYSIAFQGEIRKPVTGREFYEAVGRQDLADAFSRRKRRGWLGLGGGAAVSVGGLVALSLSLDSNHRCDGSPNWDECRSDFEASRRPYVLLSSGLVVGGLVGMVVGTYYLFARHPVGESARYDLAKEHNANLRRKYGLAVTPYVNNDGGGLAAAGRF